MSNTTQSTVETRPEEMSRYRAKSIAEMQSNPAPVPEQILGEGVLIKDSKACIYAQSKVGKSIFATQLGLCCASGTPFLEIPVIYPCNVLYLNFELDDYMTEERILGIKSKLHLDAIPKFRKLTLLGEDVPLLDTNSGLKKTAEVLKVNDEQGFRVELLIWDCRYKTVQQSENQDDVIKKWCRNMEELIKIFSFTLLVIHHKGKNTEGVGAGSSVFDRWINTSIELKPHHWESALSPSKERLVIIGGNYTPGNEKSVVLDFPIHNIGGYEVWQKPLSKKELAMNFMISELQTGEIEQEKLMEKAIAQGYTRSTIFEAKGELERKALIRTKPDTTKAGRHNVIELLLPLSEV
jgi:hypothetical protein